jgi:hypothetical protein
MNLLEEKRHGFKITIYSMVRENQNNSNRNDS